MKKMFLAALIAFGAVSFSFGYDLCISRLATYCKRDHNCISPECTEYCIKDAEDECSKHEENCRANFEAYGFKSFMDCYDGYLEPEWKDRDPDNLPTYIWE